MAGPTLAALVDRRLWVYGGGLAAVLLVRTLLAPSAGRALAVSLVLGVMVLTYAAELWHAAEQPSVRPGLLGAGVAGVVAGCWLVLTDTLAGLVFVAGGLLFLNRGLTGGGSA
jgi:hypothetical protein